MSESEQQRTVDALRDAVGTWFDHREITPWELDRGRDLFLDLDESCRAGKLPTPWVASLEAHLALAERALVEVDALKAFEHEIREAIGNTNWNVLMHHFANYAKARRTDD